MKKLSTTLSMMLVVVCTYAQFQYSIGTTVTETGLSVKSTILQKGFIVGGNTTLPVFGGVEATLVKTRIDGTKLWSSVYGNAKNETFNSVREVPFSSSPNITPGYAAFGTTNSFGFGADDMYFVRTDTAGTPLFSKVFGRAKNDRGHCLQFVKDTGGYRFVMVGETNSYPFFGGTVDVYVVKTDEFGNLIRAAVIGGPGNEIGYYIQQTRDLGYVIVGTTNTPCGSSVINQDILVIKLDANLNLMWNRTIGGGASTNADIAYSVVENPVDTTITITGQARSFGVNRNGDAFLLNLKPNGTFNWMKTYGMSKAEIGNTLHVTRNPFTGAVEYVVGGSSTSFNSTGVQDAYVFKTDASGNLLWTSLYGATNREVIYELTDSGDRGYVFTGLVNSPWSLAQDIYLTKMDLNGKTGSPCQVFVNQKVLKNEVCQTFNMQEVFVEDNLKVETLVKRVQYIEHKCDTSTATTGRVPESIYNKATDSHENVFDFKNNHVKIFNMQGQLVLEKKSTSEELTFDQLPYGMYIVHIMKSDGTIIRRKFNK